VPVYSRIHSLISHCVLGGMALFTLTLLPVGQLHAASCEPVARLVSLEGAIEYKTANTENWNPAVLEQEFCNGDAIRSGRDSRAALRMINETLLRLDHSTAIIFTSVVQKERSLLDLLKGALHFISRVPRSLEVNTPYLNAAIEGTEFVIKVKDESTEVTVYEGKVVASNASGSIDLTANQAGSATSGQAPIRTAVARPRDAVAWTLYYPPLPAQQDQAAMLAQQTIDAIVRNDIDQAVTLAQQAIANNPQSAAAYMAQSYVEQARFDIPAALENSRRAAELAPQDAITLARLAEVLLMTGDTEAARSVAENAVRIAPSLAHTQTVLGFSSLRDVNLDDAESAFQQAIILDSAAPLPRLGLGLVKIRHGDLKSGREEIETASLLDPNNALLRSYMGKAYYEEKRGKLASEQFAMARELDPNDPTPYYYDAIGKQAENRPVEALQDIEKSIELNENRSVYRSRFQLDGDEAVRSVSQARIYQNLGFEQLALVQGVKSMNTDPTNHSVHRFLADIYSSRRRHNIARVSELLQSQLLQPLNINSVQPQMGEANLFVQEGAGPAYTGFNEFNPLFTRNEISLNAAVITGSNNTLGDEVAASGIAEQLSYSVGQYHFETDGFRENNDVKYDIYNAFFQFTPSTTSSYQVEVRHLETEAGDLKMKFDSDNFLPNERSYIEQDSARLGFHLTPSTSGDIIGSLIHIDRQQTTEDRELFALPGFSLLTVNSNDTDGDAYSIELQYLHHMAGSNWLVGAGYFKENHTSTLKQVDTLTIDPDPPSTELFDPTVTSVDPKHSNAYIYSNINLEPQIVLTAGLSYDSFKDFNSDEARINPKLGLIWETTGGSTIRAAWFKTLKRPFAANQTIEPTQVAGFNQFFDDLNGTKSTRYGAAFEQQITQSMFMGVESSWRMLEHDSEEQDESLHRGYFSWAVNNQLTLNAEFLLEDFEIGIGNSSFLTDLSTRHLPLSMNYFWSNGLIAELRSSYVDQKVIQLGGITEDDQFWITDASINYRLPKRKGIVRFTIKNLLDEKFKYHDINFSTGEPLTPLFQPERQVFLDVTMSF
jgi:tetratricopeptide (TPR) repeat protein